MSIEKFITTRLFEDMSEDQMMIAWDIPMRERLRKAYQKAVAENRSTFFFETNEFVTAYAKYLIEFLDGRLDK
jgi:hypothetical protein